jgi:ribosomal protein S10
MRRCLLFLFLTLCVGCGGESTAAKRQRAMSELNVLADAWDGTEKPPATDKVDPWGQTYTASVSKGRYNFDLTVRSNGPDGLPKNSDDITVRRASPHKGDDYDAKRQRAMSDLNTIADTWDGQENPPLTDKLDPWGKPYTVSVNKGSLNFLMTVRSSGPDGLPQNEDDITVGRSRRHGETTINKEVERGGASLTRGLTKGIKEGLFGPPKEKDKKTEK